MNETPTRSAGSFPWPSLAVAIVFTIVYLAWPSAAYHPDGVVDFSSRLELFQDQRMSVFLRSVLPGHMLFDVAAMVYWKLSRLAGFEGRAIEGLTPALSVLAGMGVLVFGMTCTRLSRSRWRGAVCAAGLAASGGYWMYANNLEDILVSIVIGLAAFHFAVRAIQDRPDSARAWIAPGILAGITVLAHNTSGVIALAIAALALVAPGRRLARMAAFGVGAAAAFFLPITRIGWTNGLYHDAASFFDWFLFMEHMGLWGGGLDSPFRVLRTICQMLAWKGLVWVVGAAVAGAVLAGWAAVRLRREGGTLTCAFIVAGVLWVLPTIVFATYWEPRDPEFVLAALPPFWLLLAGGMRPEAGRLAYSGAVALFAFGLAATNLFVTAIPDSDPENVRERVYGRELTERVRVGDLIITPGSEWILTAEYFHGLDLYPFPNAIVSAGANGWPAFERDLVGRIDRAHAEGQNVYLHLWPEEGVFEWECFGHLAGGLAGLRNILARYRVTTAFEVGGQYFYRVDPPVAVGSSGDGSVP